MTIVFGTGHRPEHAGVDFQDMRRLINTHIIRRETPIDVAVCGMAAGFDLAWGLEALMHNIEVWAIKPWAGHAPRANDRRAYETVLKYAKRIVDVDESQDYPGPWVYQVRNEWMVEAANEGLAFWHGKKQGGTYNCLKYAEKRGKPVVNIYPWPDLIP